MANLEGSGSQYLDFSRFDLVPDGGLQPASGTRWVAGVDPSFSSDPLGLAIVGRALDDQSRLIVGFDDGVEAAQGRLVRGAP